MKKLVERRIASLCDLAMCGLINGVQLRHRLPNGASERLETYLRMGELQRAPEFFAIPGDADLPRADGLSLSWRSPVESPHVSNNRVRVDLHPSGRGGSAPTVMMLHALMSADDTGYRRAALRLNELGWNVCFIHLPFHYSRRPGGFLSGELAMTPDLVHTGETLRQGVVELRQLMAWCRAQGCCEFGLLATSYGAWVGALLSFVEADFRFIALMTPIVNIHHAIWESPAAVRMRWELRRHGIVPELVARHSHLTSPMHGRPLSGTDRVLLTAGRHDAISRALDLEELHRAWEGSHYQIVDQGHFGYRILPATLRALLRRGLLKRV